MNWRVILSAVVIVALGFIGCGDRKAELVGNWNIKLKVGHVGEGIRTVILELKDEEGELAGRMSKLNGHLDDVDELTYENGNLFIAFGSYEYNLRLEEGELKGMVVSPAGEQEIVGTRQESVRLQGDEVEPLRRSWRGTIAQKDGEMILSTRRGFDTHFLNADEFKDQLASLDGKTVEVTGWWMKTKIKIQEIEEVSGGRQ